MFVAEKVLLLLVISLTAKIGDGVGWGNTVEVNRQGFEESTFTANLISKH